MTNLNTSNTLSKPGLMKPSLYMGCFLRGCDIVLIGASLPPIQYILLKWIINSVHQLLISNLHSGAESMSIFVLFTIYFIQNQHFYRCNKKLNPLTDFEKKNLD